MKSKSKKQRAKKWKIAYNNRILLGYIFRFAPEMFLWKLFAIVMILISDLAFNVLFLKHVIDSMSENIRFSIVLYYIGGLALIRIVCDFANNFYTHYIEPVARLKIHKGVYNMIYERVEHIDLEKFDDHRFYNDYIWALNEVDNRIKSTFGTTMNFLQCLLNVTAYSVISMIYDRFVMIFVLIPVAVNVMIGVTKAKVNYEAVSELTPVNRKRDYSRRGFYLQQYVKEIKTSGIGALLRKRFEQYTEESIGITKKYRKRLFALSYCERHVGWMFSKVLSAAYMCYKVLVARSYTVGVFVVIYQAIGTFTNSLISLFSVVPRLQENGLFSERLIKIINYEADIEKDKAGKPMPEKFEILEMKDVSFRYPNNNEFALKKFTLTIGSGDKIAFVGLNGAGKSTLVKLILRFYDPQEGGIYLNGIDIREYNIKEYRRFFSTIFQDYQIFAVRLIENIFMEEAGKELETKAIQYLHQSNLTEYDNQLWNEVTKEFDKNGIVLSGGQAQKLAIARAMAKDGEIVIMDEASSALDPIAEAEIYKAIMKEMNDKAFVVISHRLSTIRYMDRIFFIENGEIAENGTHAQLMKKEGRYAKLYQTQAEKYKENTEK